MRGVPEHVQLAWTDLFIDSFCGSDDIRHVRIFSLSKRRWHADADRLQVSDLREIPGHAKTLVTHRLLKVVFVDVRDIGPAVKDRLNALRINIDACDVEAGIAERQPEWQADITEADNADRGRPRCDLRFEFNVGFGFDRDIVFDNGTHGVVYPLFHRHAFGQVSWLINIAASQDGNVVSEQLQRYRR